MKKRQAEKRNETISPAEKKSSWKKWPLPVAMLVALSAYPALFLFFQNADAASFSEVVMPLLLFIAAALGFFAVLLVVMRDPAKSALGAAVVMLILLNYALLEKGVRMLFPTAYYWHILPTFLVLAVCLLAVIRQMLPTSAAEAVNAIICLVFAALILLNGVMAVPTMIKRSQMEREAEENAANLAIASSGAMPNIYYLIFDEYSSIDFMKKYFDYDNSAFTDYLEDIGFNVSYTSHNDSIITSTVITNLVNLDYVVDNTWSELDKKEKRMNNVLFPLLWEHGYQVVGAAGAETYGLTDVTTNNGGGSSTMEGDTISDLILKNTFLYPWITPDNTDLFQLLSWMKNPANYADSNQFTMFHINLPHTPFLYDRNGHLNAHVSSDWHNPENYLGQYIFTTGQMKEIVASIIKNDPDSIIFLTSDHGARASTSWDLFMSIFPLEDMSNCFESVYYQGKDLEIEGLSGVNVLRTVLNELLGTSFDMCFVPEDTYWYK